eukprot:5316883-Prymnesium_polylepis.2
MVRRYLRRAPYVRVRSGRSAHGGALPRAPSPYGLAQHPALPVPTAGLGRRCHAPARHVTTTCVLGCA